MEGVFGRDGDLERATLETGLEGVFDRDGVLGMRGLVAAFRAEVVDVTDWPVYCGLSGWIVEEANDCFGPGDFTGVLGRGLGGLDAAALNFVAVDARAEVADFVLVSEGASKLSCRCDCEGMGVAGSTSTVIGKALSSRTSAVAIGGSGMVIGAGGSQGVVVGCVGGGGRM